MFRHQCFVGLILAFFVVLYASLVSLVSCLRSSASRSTSRIQRGDECNQKWIRRFGPQHLYSGTNSPAETRNLAVSTADMKKKTSSLLLKSLLSAGLFQTSLKAVQADVQNDVASCKSQLSSVIELQQINNVVRTKPLDERQFRAIELDNKLRVLLVSDPSSSRSAAAMDVKVGSFSDPREVPGLAHFCEHMSFLGTKKYPKEDEFSSYLSSHGGTSNAYTDSEDTVYYFDVNAEFTKPALDRFVQFFVSPLFTQSATSRELNAIDSEHNKNLNNDGFRFYQLEKDGANPAHPLSKFATGNKDTLEKDTIAQGIDVRKVLLDFHQTRYSSNRMTLCIVGKQNLDQLQKWATSLFRDVPNRDAPNPADEYWGKIPPFLPQTEASLLEIVPVGEQRLLSLAWPIWVVNQAQRDTLIRTKPDQIVAHLLGHEGKGSLRSFLVSKGWSNDVQAAVTNDVSDMQHFEVIVDLTDEGLKHRDDVADAIFAYMHKMRDGDEEGKGTTAIPPYVYQEVKQLSFIGFNYSEKSGPSSMASNVVANMQEFTNPADYLTGPSLFEYPDPCEVQKYLSYLTPINARVKVVSNDFQGNTQNVAKYYGTNFNNKTLPVQTKRWTNTLRTGGGGIYSQMHLPEPNLLIPERFDLLGGSNKKISEEQQRVLLSKPPHKFRDDEKWTIWHKLDRSFNQPKVYAILLLAVPADRFNEDFVVKSKLFSYCFLDSMNEFLYDARLAGLGFELDFTNKGLQIIISGYNDKMPSFARIITQALKSYQPDVATFNRYKDLLKREFLSWRTQQPYNHCSHYASLATETLQFKIPESIAALDKVTDPKSLHDFLQSTVSRSHGTALIVGNVNEKGAEEIVDIVDKTFAYEPLARELRSRRRLVTIPLSPRAANTLLGSASSTAAASGYLVKHEEPNVDDDNSAVIFYFQMPSRELGDTILVELLSEAIEQSFYNSLRTQQQLGYIVYSGARSRDGILSLTLTVQSAVVDGAELTRRVEAFVENSVKDLVDISDEEFESYKEGIAVRKLEPDQRLTDQAGRFWAEIMETRGHRGDTEEEVPPLFNRYELEVKAIRAVSKQQFVQFGRDFLSPDGSKRRLLVSQITSQKAPVTNSAITTAATTQTITTQNDSQSTAPSSSLPLSVSVDLVEIPDEVKFRISQPFV